MWIIKKHGEFIAVFFIVLGCTRIRVAKWILIICYFLSRYILLDFCT